jgi:hypothetical protein
MSASEETFIFLQKGRLNTLVFRINSINRDLNVTVLISSAMSFCDFNCFVKDCARRQASSTDTALKFTDVCY